MKRIAAAGLLALLAAAVLSGVAAAPSSPTVRIITRAGRVLEGTLTEASLPFRVGDAVRKLTLRELRSFHSAAPAAPGEAARIREALSVVAGPDRRASEAAAAELVEIGLPVLSPLLAAYRDTDGHEPDPLYRLFARLVPGHADRADRSLDMARLAGGEALRGRLVLEELRLKPREGPVQVLPAAEVRQLAVRQAVVERAFELHSLRHCTHVAFLDTGVRVTPASELRSEAEGYVRLSFDEDGWACDPDGIADPLPGKRRLQEGFRWGAVLGRIGPEGARWLAGRRADRRDLGAGRLYFVVNDNEHWQNNIGSFRVRLRVTEAYDLGEPQ